MKFEAPGKARRDAQVCRYKCGDCGHESVAPWKRHNMHYAFHRLRELDEELGIET